MQQFLAAGVIVMLSLGGVLAKQAAAPAGAKGAASVSQTLIDMEQQWNKASKAGDADALAVFLADDLVYLDSDGTMRTKAEVLARTKKAKWTMMELSDMKVTMHGELAFVHSLNHVNATLASGHVTDLWLRWTACFRRIYGVWLVVHDHVSVPADLEHGHAVLNLAP